MDLRFHHRELLAYCVCICQYMFGFARGTAGNALLPGTLYFFSISLPGIREDHNGKIWRDKENGLEFQILSSTSLPQGKSLNTELKP